MVQKSEATTKPVVFVRDQNTVKKPKKVSSLKVKKVGRRKLRVSWKWFAVQDGFKVQYALNRSFTKQKKSKMYNNLKDSITLKGLKRKKTYYVRVRAYRKKSGKKIYGKWSKVKKVKIKK